MANMPTSAKPDARVGGPVQISLPPCCPFSVARRDSDRVLRSVNFKAKWYWLQRR